jgi:hypothetical protein
MTDPRARRLVPRWGLPLLAGVLCVAGLALLLIPRLVAAALGVELIAAAFWLGARAARDPVAPLRRWEWLRRPASALWVGVALQGLERIAVRDGIAPESFTLLVVQVLGRLAVCWSGLDLLGALPGVRAFSDRSGPLAGGHFRMPALLPAAGALLFLRQTTIWTLPVLAFSVIEAVLVVAALVAALRALVCISWRRSLRWLIATECALAGLHAAVAPLSRLASLALWVGACGGLALWLVAEHRGAALRRSPDLIALWRIAAWVSTTAFGWPLVFGALGAAHRQVPLAVAVGGVTALVAWIVVRRPQPAPERRGMTRAAPPLSFHRVAALLTLLVGPVTLVASWAPGGPGRMLDPWLALLPFLIGGGLTRIRRVEWPRLAVKRTAQTLFHLVTRTEHVLVARGGQLGRALATPLRDLHSGDAQEYLLFLIGMCVLMLLIPVLQ